MGRSADHVVFCGSYPRKASGDGVMFGVKVTDYDRRVWEEELCEFLPEKYFKAGIRKRVDESSLNLNFLSSAKIIVFFYNQNFFCIISSEPSNDACFFLHKTPSRIVNGFYKDNINA